jgi:hypothetical protein
MRLGCPTVVVFETKAMGCRVEIPETILTDVVIDYSSFTDMIIIHALQVDVTDITLFSNRNSFVVSCTAKVFQTIKFIAGR